MEWDDFEARARAVIPRQELKPRRCWIGVLSHEKTPQDALSDLDFVWMIGHLKIPIQKVYETYQSRHTDVQFELKFKDALVDKSDTIKTFLAPDANIVLFLACLPQDNHPQQQLAAPSPSPAQARRSSPSSSSLARWAKDEPEDYDAPLPPPPSAVLPLAQQDEFSVATVGTEATQNHASPAMNHDVEDAGQPAPNDYQKGGPTARLPVPQSTVTAIKNENIPSHIAHPYMDENIAGPVVHPHMDEETQVPFDPERFFKRESSAEQTSQENMKPTDRSIREIITRTDVQMLEAGVAQALQVLQSLKLSFQRYAEHHEARAWIEAIEKLIPQADRKRTIVGVVGNTGAGKSSVINAMLDEERLVPTNCMRACTAVVTEMSWNDCTDPARKYRAEIEFITREDWKKEVTTLMKEFLTETGTISRDVSDENSDAGIAWAKFHSVYPKRTRDSLSDCTVESLIAERSVMAILGTTKKISTAYPDLFYQQLQRYIDSKEKVTKKGKDKGQEKQKKTFEMEYWPLIKVVKIYVKAPALSTGAVIVDLPGVHDSNAARAAVAQGYMKQCTGLWIVAPINRAVDDKAAKTLLGETFKRQLKYDGGFSSVTFICSKTDDISITEAIDTLELEDEVEELYEQQRNCEREIKSVQDKMKELGESQAVYKIALMETANDIETWEELPDRLENGETVYPPKPKQNKRKKFHGRQNDARKRQQKDCDDSEDDFIVSDDESTQSESDDASDDEDIQAPQVPLTKDEARMKIKGLREAKKSARRASLELSTQMKELKPRIRDLEAEMSSIEADISHICIAGRNDYSKRAIQQDFASGLKELDQENAAEEDEDNFNPDEDMRDYEQVAKSLPVFCVSSRAYQQMCGRLQKDARVPGFKDLEETDMPQLQAHCKKLTEAGRIATARSFLLSLCQQLTTFSLWASDDGTGLKMTDDDKRKQVKYLENRLSGLERGLEEAVRACLNVMKKEMNDQIFDKYPELINEAIAAAPGTAQKWGAHKMDGGLFWATYKAVVRRDGTYHSSSAGHRDFNAELVSPIIKKLATGWERAFQSRLPKAFDAFIKDSGRLLHSFHQAVEERARSNGVGLANLAALKTQIYTYEQLFADLNQVLVARMTELQREANRDFTPTIANIMHTVYDICTNEHGTGSFKRMKEHMTNFVTQYRHRMFHDATVTVKNHLDAMCKELEDVMEERADEIFIKMKADYNQVLGGGQLPNGEATPVLPRAERAMRSEVMQILRTVDAQFEPIARGEIEQVNSAEQGDAPADEQDVMEEDNDESAFMSAHESTGHADDDSIMGDVNDTVITEPTPAKRFPAGISMDDASPTPSKQRSTDVPMSDDSEKENSERLTPTSKDIFADEDEL